MPRKAKLLDNTDDEASDTEAATLNVNADYARRFEHNKQRAEQHRLEDKYGKDEGSDSEDGVEEDDAAELLDDALDDEVMATLNALRAKDPRIYDKDAKFYRDLDDAAAAAAAAAKPDKKDASMTLRQYHTQNLLEGRIPGEDDDDDDANAPPRTYAQEQEAIRQNLVKEMHAAADAEDDDFLVAKPKPESTKPRVKMTVDDVVKADHDPETFLSNYMASRAWVPTDVARFQPLESDDDDADAAADDFEHAYNTYFEDTTGTNEKITTYARDAVAATTVRRDDGNSRKKARDAARAKREAERQQREAEVARLRKLKVNEMEEKVKQIRKVGGLTGRDFDIEEWKDVLEGDWSDDAWDREMAKRFGEAYYAEGDARADSDDERKSKKKKPKKPKFDDDIDIKDLVPDFVESDDERPDLSDDDEADAADAADDDDDAQDPTAPVSSKKHKQARADAKSTARRDRRLIENLVSSNLEYETALAAKPKAPTRFRYRETSPTSFGLTARDILLADDKALNEFAGLKKLAAFRDPVKKKKDKKFLSKKARLRQWRQETFGDAEGPKGGFEALVGAETGAAEGAVTHAGKKRKAEGEDGARDAGEAQGGIVEGKKRRRKRKGGDKEKE